MSDLKKELSTPSPDRIWFLADALRNGMTVQEVFNTTKIDPWFISQIEDLIVEERALKKMSLTTIDRDYLLDVKKKGFSDSRLAFLLKTEEKEIRKKRKELEVIPVFKRVDTCAAEFESSTAYMYSTYEEECESSPSSKKKVIVLGGGPNRIGQGIEFDYCCVHAALAMKEEGYESIMVNCNPETVSTDYDVSDRLYFEPITTEDVLTIIELEKPLGVIVQYGGQTPLKLAKELEENGVPIWGTSPDSIDLAEDRGRFQKFVHKLKLTQPPNGLATNQEEAMKVSTEIGFPLVVRPSYVLGGRAMDCLLYTSPSPRDRSVSRMPSSA